MGSGLSVGYGIVSVRQDLITVAASQMNDVEEIGSVTSQVATPTAFQHRLACRLPHLLRVGASGLRDRRHASCERLHPGVAVVGALEADVARPA